MGHITCTGNKEILNLICKYRESRSLRRTRRRRNDNIKIDIGEIGFYYMN